MKFLSLALAAVLSLADAKPLTNEVIQQKLRSGQFDKKTLMAKAVPYNRKLQENNNEYGITSAYSVHFNECVTLKIKDNNLLADDYVEVAKNGQLLSEKSYVVFSMCETESCGYDVEDASSSYIVDVNTFVMALSYYLPTKKANYCESCERNVDYCNGNYAAQAAEAEAAEGEAEAEQEPEGEGEQEGEPEGEGEGQEAEGGGRRLASYIDCAVCEEYECFAEDAADDAAADELINYDSAYEYIEGLSNCYDTGLTLDNMELYAGLICNSDGTGVEIGVFLDGACTLYTTKQSFTSILSEDDTPYLTKASELVTYLFTTDIPCYEDRTEYTNPYDEAEQHEQNNEEDRLAEWCQDLFRGDEFTVQNLATCEAEENDDVNNDDMAQAWTNVNWYSWDLSPNDAEEAAKTCYIIQQWGGDYTSHHVYNKKASGTVFDYSQGKQKSKGKGAIIAIVIIILLVAAAGLYWALQGKSKADKKRTPLINGSVGSMA